jgi:hypothetical protein
MKKGLLFSVVALFCVALVYAAATKFTNLEVTGDLSVGGNTTVSNLIIPEVNVAVTTPTATGLLVRNSSYVLYISTLTTGINGWQKVGSQ